MPNKKKAIDPLPKSFASEEQAGEFWDTHSLMDYDKLLEPADHSVKIEKRVFEVRIAEDVFQNLQKKAQSLHKSVPTVVDAILRKELTV